MESWDDSTQQPLLEPYKRLFSSSLKKSCVDIAFLIRIKEGVRQPGLECEAFAVNVADAICAERVEELILAWSAGQFNAEFCGGSSNSGMGDVSD